MLPNSELLAEHYATQTGPQGWFRVLHYGRSGRNNSFPKQATLEANWTPELISQNPWQGGFQASTGVLNAAWPTLTQAQRAIALAGHSEANGCTEWLKTHISDGYSTRDCATELDAVSTCQLACNAIKDREPWVLIYVLQSSKDLTGSVTREANRHFQETIDLLSNRCIDLVLEAALIKEDVQSAKAALEAGANPNIPMWVLESSCNAHHCPLSYSLAMNGYHTTIGAGKELVELLLKHRADPVGPDFVTKNLPLFYAMSYPQIAEEFLQKGASFAKQPGTTCTRNYYCHSSHDISWAQSQLGAIIDFVSISEKAAFHNANAQGGYCQTFLDKAQNNGKLLRHYKKHGLDCRPTAEELLHILEGKAWNKLNAMLSEFKPAQRKEIIREIKAAYANIDDWKEPDDCYLDEMFQEEDEI